MPIVDNARVHVKTTVPPGRSLVGVYPQTLFRIDRFHLPDAPGLALAFGGRLVPCDGKVHRNESLQRTLCVGNFFAFDVDNTTGEPRAFELTVSGPAVDGPLEHEGWVVMGTIALDESPANLSPVMEDAR